MTERRCIGDPVSWLALERYQLGELPARQRRAVATHLAACAACAACLAEGQRALPMPALPADARRPSLWARMRRALGAAGLAGVGARVAFAGAGAALALALLMRPKPPADTFASVTLPGIKGGGVAISLARERNGVVDDDATTFTAGDRWKVLVTCPAERVLFWDVAVFEDGAASFPLSPAAPIACGNRVPLPGAFRVDGDSTAEVCLFLASDPVDRARVSSLGRAACVTLRPAR